jgi:metal-responsive CopG/Arc/MetJ family transcriptional regulator
VEKTIMMVMVPARNVLVPKVQEALSEFGCLIKTRLGIHDTSPAECSNCGLMILELVGEKKEQDKLAKKLKAIKGVQVKTERFTCK